VLANRAEKGISCSTQGLGGGSSDVPPHRFAPRERALGTYHHTGQGQGRRTGTGCPGRLWSLLLWRYSSPAWTRCCAACSGWPCFVRVLDWVTHRRPCQPLTFC